MRDSVSIRIERLNDNNYPVWKRQMRALLIEREYWPAVLESGPLWATSESSNPTAASPASSTASDDRQAQRQLLSDKAVAAMIQNISQSLLHLVRDDDSAKVAWERIEATFASKVQARRVQLRRELNALRMEAKESISSYFGRAIRMRDELSTAGVTIDDKEFLTFIYAGLPSAYDNR